MYAKRGHRDLFANDSSVDEPHAIRVETTSAVRLSFFATARNGSFGRRSGWIAVNGWKYQDQRASDLTVLSVKCCHCGETSRTIVLCDCIVRRRVKSMHEQPDGVLSYGMFVTRNVQCCDNSDRNKLFA